MWLTQDNEQRDRRFCILVVDDDSRNRELLETMLEVLDYDVIQASNGVQALERLSPAVDLVLMDVMMPKMDGFEATKRMREQSQYQDLPVIFVTSLSEKEDRLHAVEVGANDFIAKPVEMAEVRVRTNSQLKLKAAQDALKRHNQELEEAVRRRTAQLEKAHQDTQAAYLDTIQRLAIAAEYKDEDTADHIRRMCRYCAVLAAELGLSEHEIWVVQHATPMHDVGKIGVPDSILLKPGKLDPDEWQIMKEHTLIGARILAGADSDLLRAGEVIARTHHERWDGSGYPDGLAGEEIPLHGRICAVADVFDALTNRRPYKPAFSNEKSIEIMRSERDAHFDPKVLDAFLDSLDKIEAIQKEYQGNV